MLKKIIGFWITILISNVSFSQCEIKGKVVDDQKIPLEFVTVELYKDSIFQVGGITEKNGGFELKAKINEVLVFS